jgi:hypothetical protein
MMQYNPKKAIRNDAKWCQVMPRISASVKEAERQLGELKRQPGKRDGGRAENGHRRSRWCRKVVHYLVTACLAGKKVKGTTRHRWAEPQCQQLQNAQPVQYFQTDWCVHCDGNRYSTVMYCMELGTRTCDIGHTWRPKYCWRCAGLGRPPCTGTEKVGNLRGSAQAPPLRSWRLSRLVEQLSRSVWSISMYIDWSRF